MAMVSVNLLLSSTDLTSDAVQEHCMIYSTSKHILGKYAVKEHGQ